MRLLKLLTHRDRNISKSTVLFIENVVIPLNRDQINFGVIHALKVRKEIKQCTKTASHKMGKQLGYFIERKSACVLENDCNSGCMLMPLFKRRQSLAAECSSHAFIALPPELILLRGVMKFS